MYIRDGPTMDVLIQDLDDSTYRAIRARAALEGRPVGELATEALRAYLARNASAEGVAPDEAINGAAEELRLLDETPSTRRGRDGKPIDEIVYLYCL